MHKSCCPRFFQLISHLAVLSDSMIIWLPADVFLPRLKERMFTWIYSILLTIAGCLYLPKLLYQRFFYGKYRNSLRQRMGLDWPELPQKPVIWLHAVSVGETKAIATLAAELHTLQPHYPLIVSSITETGHAEAKRLIPQAKVHVFLPFDLPWLVRPLLRTLDIRLLVISENDLWPAFMEACKSRGAHISLVNGKMSERSLNRLLWCSPLRKHFTGLLDSCCVQNDIYAQRFAKLGVSIQNLNVTGNLKYDANICHHVPPAIYVHLGWGDAKKAQFITAGSTHAGEEEIVLDLMHTIWKTYPQLQLLLAPRHPERFNAVASLLERQNIPFMRWSEGYQAPWQVALIDTIGVLPQLYAASSIAIVGGSMIKGVGGHNIIEPCLAGTPVIFGPYMQQQSEMVDIVSAYGAGQQIVDGKELAELSMAWLSEPAALEQLQTGCHQLSSEVRGSTAKTYSHIEHFLKTQPAHV
jgi:3-deoxy-D-manno-octulosonic-acid transferase